MNPVLFGIILAIAAWSFCSWQSPKYLRQLAARALARAEAKEAYDREFKARLAYHRSVLVESVE
jgi:hypothetical protein